MADVIITFTIMPVSPEIDLDEVAKKATALIASFEGEVGKTLIEPVAFGLKSLKLIFVRDEKLGTTDELEEQIEKMEGVNSIEVTDVRRAIG
ncbi:elongation factor 1-beta [Candidatus Woesearchaeota archaeon]|jgi:elongation factor 1-beta|nr:elongation factor 1-beta [Candidatus Woesearchaeota archaeon]MBT6519185.1 elongation factor 1-beta [Candidatus Woesearchaeota archaeon]MBT7367657.1 elongation factor 1-beta [Candidatus Woesearchaeota archaeon]